MNDQTDQQLLQDYAERHSEAAFAAIVQRYVDLVYSAAFRMVCDAHAAKDVTQSVFVALAQNARQLADRPALAGWLHGTARNLAVKAIRSDARRRSREQETAVMHEILSAHPDASWEHIAPHLDEALGYLDDTDREAVLLRYFKNHDLRTVGATLGISDDAAQKRVSRAVERLREFFAKRGITVGASGLAVVISANAVQAAPVGLALTISTAAALTGTTLVTTATVTATKAIAMTALQKTLVTATIAVLAGAGIYEARQAAQLREQVQTFQQQQVPLAQQIEAMQSERDDAAQGLESLREEFARVKNNNLELLRLRAEVTRLRQQNGTRTASEKEVDASGLFRKVMIRYQSLTNYSDFGTAISSGSLTNSFRTALTRSGNYLIDWDQKTLPEFSFHGAVWSLGNGDFFFNSTPDGKTIYRRMKDSYSVRTEGMGFSGGATMQLPNIFYGRMPAGVISYAGEERVRDVDCDKFNVVLMDRRWSFWVGKNDLLIRKYEELYFSKPTGKTASSTLNDATIATALTKLGEPVTPESKAWMQQTIENLQAKAETDSQPVFVEFHDNIVVNEPIILSELIPEIPVGLKPTE